MKKISFLSVLLIFSFQLLLAQKEANIWYFGSLAGIDFNSGVPVALNNGQLNTSEGCSSISDGNGNLLFYTDGITVWDRTHSVMSNGNGLLGNSSSSQSGLIVQKPGSSTIYYIFVIDIDYSYSIVDMSLNGGFGAITTKNVILLSNCASEKQCGTHHANGFDIWVMMNETANNGFKSFLLTSTGINPVPVVSNVGLVHGGAYGQMKFSPDGSRAAVGVFGTGSGLELYDFDNSTGIVSNSMPIPTTYTQCYGVEFSPDNSKVYVTANPGLNEVYQFDLTAGNAAAIKATETLVGTNISGVDATGMQLGPDGKIYISVISSPYLDVIDAPNNTGLACNYIQNAVSLTPGSCQLGLPEFVSSIFKSFNIQNTCLGDSTYFSVTNTSNLAATQWNFGDTASGINNIAYVFNPVHYYASPGIYTLQLITYFLSGATDTSYTQVEIHALPQPNLGNDTTVCQGGSLVLNAGAYAGYLWQDGSSLSTFTVTDSGYYSVTVDEGGCKGTDSVYISLVPCTFPVVNLAASDTSFCEKQCLNFYDLSTNNPTSWQWFFPGADSTSSNEQNPTGICYNAYGSFDVTLIACNAVGCDTLVLTNFINEYQSPPVPTITANFDTLFSSPAFSYQWYNLSGIIPGATNQYYVYPQQGAYYVVITDSNGCATSSVVIYTGVNEYGNDEEILQLFPNPSDGNFELIYNGAMNGKLICTIYDVAGRIIYSSLLADPQVKLNLADLANGIYHLKLETDNRILNRKMLINR